MIAFLNEGMGTALKVRHLIANTTSVIDGFEHMSYNEVASEVFCSDV